MTPDNHPSDSGNCPELNEYDTTGFSAVVLCTAAGSLKYRGMAQKVHFMGLPYERIGSASAHTIQEGKYNEALSNRPDLVAAVKCLQIVTRYPGIIDGLFGEVCANDIRSYPVAFIANDIMLDLRRADGSWKALQKPSESASRDELVESLHLYLTGKQYSCDGVTEGRFRCGAACAVVLPDGSIRGIAGTMKLYFWFHTFTPSEISEYVEANETRLSSTNFGLHWEQPLLSSHIRSINGVERTEDDFPYITQYFQSFILGELPGLPSLLQSADIYRQKHSHGQITPEVKKCMRGLLKENGKPLHVSDAEWGAWNVGM